MVPENLPKTKAIGKILTGKAGTAIRTKNGPLKVDKGQGNENGLEKSPINRISRYIKPIIDNEKQIFVYDRKFATITWYPTCMI